MKSDSKGPRAYAWEFLRRNPGYRSDWQVYQDRFKQLVHRLGRQPTNEELSGLSQPELTHHEPARNVDESVEDWFARTDGTMTRLDGWIARKWHIRPLIPHGLLDPNCAECDGFTFARDAAAVTVITTPDDDPCSPPTSRVLQFDLTRPLDVQINAAAEYLKKQQMALKEQGTVTASAIAGRQRLSDWTRYLEILDRLEREGVADGKVPAALVRQLAEEFFPKEDCEARIKKLEQNIERALELRDGGYSNLPGMAVDGNHRSVTYLEVESLE